MIVMKYVSIMNMNCSIGIISVPLKWDELNN